MLRGPDLCDCYNIVVILVTCLKEEQCVQWLLGVPFCAEAIFGVDIRKRSKQDLIREQALPFALSIGCELILQ